MLCFFFVRQLIVGVNLISVFFLVFRIRPCSDADILPPRIEKNGTCLKPTQTRGVSLSREVKLKLIEPILISNPCLVRNETKRNETRSADELK